MRVVLIQPPIQDFYDTDVRLQPIGLAYLKAAVRKRLPDVEIIIKDYHGGCGRCEGELAVWLFHGCTGAGCTCSPL